MEKEFRRVQRKSSQEGFQKEEEERLEQELRRRRKEEEEEERELGRAQKMERNNKKNEKNRRSSGKSGQDEIGPKGQRQRCRLAVGSHRHARTQKSVVYSHAVRSTSADVGRDALWIGRLSFMEKK